jgi:hypothetical protein
MENELVDVAAYTLCAQEKQLADSYIALGPPPEGIESDWNGMALDDLLQRDGEKSKRLRGKKIK